MFQNEEIIKGTITTNSISSGLLNPEQAKQFIKQTFDATPLASAVRHEMRRARTGYIDKIGIAKRIVRKKVENADDGYRATVTPSQVEYKTTAIRLPWEITGETLRENIEGQGFEATVTNLMTTQLGVDLEDLYLNGDEATPAQYDTGKKDGETNPIMAATPDYDFLSINDGWLKQIKANGHIVDVSSKNSGAMSLDMFYDALKSMPNKYNNGKLRWVMSPHRAQEWELYLLNKAISAGGMIPQSMYNEPAKIPVISCPSIADDCILLTDPNNLIVVNTYGVQIRKTDTDKESIMQDKIFYAVHLDFDAIIEEADATAIITGIA